MTAKKGSGRRFEIEGVNGVGSRLAITLHPGMNLLAGENAAGKTSATMAIARASGGKESVVLADGFDRGSITGPGVIVRVGARTSVTGSPSVELADYGLLAGIIQPKGESEETRRKAQARALLSLAEIEVDEPLLLRLASEEEEVVAGVQLKQLRDKGAASLPEVTRRLRDMAHAIAREREAQRDARAAEVKRLEPRLRLIASELAGYRKPDESVAELREAVRIGLELLGRLRERTEVRTSLEQAAGGLLGQEKPDIEKHREAYRRKMVERSDAEATLKKIDAELAAIREAGNLEAERMRQWEEAEAARGKIASLPSPADIKREEDEITELRADLEVAELYDEQSRLEETVRQLSGERDDFARLAEHFRDVAARTSDRVNEILREQDFGPLLLDKDEGLCVLDESTGALEPFERLSLGERTSLVLLNVGLRSYPGRVMPLDPGFWYALQPAAQREVVASAISAGVELISEVPIDRPGVYAVHLGQEWIESGETAESYVVKSLNSRREG